MNTTLRFPLWYLIFFAAVLTWQWRNAHSMPDEPFFAEESLLNDEQAVPGILEGSFLELWGFVVGKSKLHDIQNSLGPAKLFSSGQFQHSSKSICYQLRTKNNSNTVFVVFNSGAMGGWERITSYSIASSQRLNKFADYCVNISPNSVQIKEVANLRIGMPRHEFLSVLEFPKSKVISGNVARRFRTEIHMTNEEKINYENLRRSQSVAGIYDTYTGVIGYFRNDLLDSFTVYKLVEAY